MGIYILFLFLSFLNADIVVGTQASEAMHALVSFYNENDAYCVVPIFKVSGNLVVGTECSVQWTKRKSYPAILIAIGKLHGNSCVNMHVLLNSNRRRS